MKVFKSSIIENINIVDRIFKLTAEFTSTVKPGQFFMIKTLDNCFLLPRPISVNDVNEGSISFLYRTEGIGTTKISTMKSGESLQLFGPLGNGFDLSLLKGNVAIIGGGIGIAPLLYLSKKLDNKADVYLGFKDCVYIVDDFKKYCNNLLITTENGSIGHKGFITDFIDYKKYDAVVTCGPEIMMNKIMNDSKRQGLKCYVSLERRMACGMGVCLGCTVITKEGNKRACKDGPVFDSEDLI